jgi:hypothetical protein
MPGPEFFQTKMGHRFFEATMPRIAGALEKIAKKMEDGKTVKTVAMNEGKNPRGIVLEFEETGDPGIYQEQRISAMKGEECVADVLVQVDKDGEVRVLITSGGEGDGDHSIAIYPERDGDSKNFIEYWF